MYLKTSTFLIDLYQLSKLFLLDGIYRDSFLKKATSFITVRDPFERLVSAYMVGWTYFRIHLLSLLFFQDKLVLNISRNDTTWKTFGKIQQNIKRNLREEKRPDLVPTFPEFAIYLVIFMINNQLGLTRIFQANVLSPDPDVMSEKKIYHSTNNHWKPIYLNCAPCIQR